MNSVLSNETVKIFLIISILLILVVGVNGYHNIVKIPDDFNTITGSVIGSNITILSGQWAAVSKNTLNDVLWRSGGLTITQIKQGNVDPQNYFSAWNGGAFDTITKKLWIAAQGGDADGADNGIYVFDLTTGLWSMITPPTVNLIPPYPSTGTWPYIDTAGTYGPVGKAYPQSRHTYGASIAIPDVGAWIGGGVAWHPYNIQQADIARSWQATSSGWQGPFDSVGSYNEGRWGAWDSIKSRVLFQDNDRLRAYDPAKPVGSRVTIIDDGSQPSDSRNRFCSGAFDSKRNRLVGACVTSTGIPTIEGFDLGTIPIKRKTFLTAAPWGWTAAPGFIYDNVGDRYVLWPNGGAKLYIIDPVSFTVTTLVGGGVDPGTPTSAYGGTWGRFAYVPGDDVYILANKVAGPVYAFRPDRNGTIPTPSPVITFTSSPTSITSGQSSTLSWTSSDATSCTASGAWSGTKATSGSQVVNPATTSTYTLACIGSGGTTTQSTTVTVTSVIDTALPTVSISFPASGATLSGTVILSASASDNIGVVGVQFKLDGTNLGIEDPTSPYSISWDTKTASNGAHTLIATARDLAGNVKSSDVTVTVSNIAASQEIVTDDFERSRLGTNWDVTWGNPGIISNSDLGILSGDFSRVDWVGSTFSADQFSEAVISLDKDPKMLTQVFVRRRLSDGARYGFHYNPGLTPPRWEIKYDGVPSTLTRILDTSTAPGPAAGDTIRIEAVGNTIRGFHNSALILTAADTDSNKITDGRPGLAFRLEQNNPVSSPAPVFESWTGGSLKTTPISTVQIDIPTGVFMVMQLPYRGQGIGNNKHVTFAWNPLDGRLYSVGGDWSDSDFPESQSYSQAMYSLSIKGRWDDKANPAAGWRKEQTYCRSDGGIQPKHPDFVGWTWDSKRNVFWMVPGTMEISSTNCPEETGARVSDPKFLLNHLMTWDPVTKQWTDQGTDIGPTSAETWKSHYDPVTDSLIRFGFDGGSGAVVNIYNIPTKTWSKFGLGVNALGRDIRVNKEGSDVDYEGRFIYTVDGFAGRLHRYNMNTKILADLGPVPGGTIAGGTTFNDAYVAWDKIHKVLFFWRIDQNSLHVYDPANSTWQNISTVTSPSGLTPNVRHTFVFDPGQNVIVMDGSTDTSNTNMFLFRYAPGVGVPITPPDTTAPTVSITLPLNGATVANIISVTVSASDDIGVVGVQFKLDGTNIGAEDFSSPYAIPFNTTTVLNGAHTLTAVARDLAGNTKTSAPISITVSNLGDIIIPTVSISTSSTSITTDNSSTLTWSTTNAVSCTASGAWSGTKALSGTQSVSPTSTSTYTLTCTGAGGSTTKSVTITVTSLPVPTLSFSALPMSITSGNFSTLTWRSTDATSCTASGAWSGTKTTSGNQTIHPTSMSTYILTCNGPGGSISKSVTIIVTTSPVTPNTTDSDSDGMPDILDKCPLTKILVVDRYGCPVPKRSEFTSDVTTDFTSADIRDMKNLTIGITSLGTIDFSNNSIDLVYNNTEQVDLDSIIDILLNKVIVRSELFPALNKSAIIALDLVDIINPLILKNGQICSECSIISFIGSKLKFSVPHFTEYSIIENYCGNSYCTYDENCSICSTDCGVCNVEPPNNETVNVTYSSEGFYECTTRWKCLAWSACAGGFTTRDCYYITVPQYRDEFGCPTVNNPPENKLTCVQNENIENIQVEQRVQPQEKSVTIPPFETEPKKSNQILLASILIVAVLVTILIIIIMIHSLRKDTEFK